MATENTMAAKHGRTGKRYAQQENNIPIASNAFDNPSNANSNQADGHPPEAASHLKESSSPYKGSATLDTYRVRGIPHGIGVANLKKTLLNELFESNSSAEVSGEPVMIQYEYPGADAQTALIRFSEKPEVFKRQAQYALNTWRGAVIDREFFGFTTLYEGQRDQPIAAEFVSYSLNNM